MNRRGDDNPIVWSSEKGDLRKPDARERRPDARGKPPAPRGGSGAGGDPADGVVRVRRETSGRKGKGVTTISGVPLGEAELRELAGELKRRCGTGGTTKDGVIEIQGDHREEVIPLLEARGWTVKRAGG